MSEVPPSNYPRPSNSDGEPEASRTKRYLGCGCLFLPIGLFAFMMTAGFLMGEGPQPNGSIGWEPGRGWKILLALAFFVATSILGSRWLQGRPRARNAVAGLILGLILVPVSLLLLTESNGLAWPFAALSAALLIGSSVGDRAP